MASPAPPSPQRRRRRARRTATGHGCRLRAQQPLRRGGAVSFSSGDTARVFADGSPGRSARQVWSRPPPPRWSGERSPEPFLIRFEGPVQPVRLFVGQHGGGYERSPR